MEALGVEAAWLEAEEVSVLSLTLSMRGEAGFRLNGAHSNRLQLTLCLQGLSRRRQCCVAPGCCPLIFRVTSVSQTLGAPSSQQRDSS